MRRFLAGTSNCASVLAAALVAAFVTVSSASDVALSDSSGSDASLPATPPVPPCGSNEPTDQSNPSPGSEPACADTPRTPEEVAEARAYLVETASPGYTMTLQGPELAIGRLHPEFAVRLEHAIREARGAGLPFAAVFSAYRPPAFGVGGFSDKFNSLHTYGLAVDMRGIGSPGSPEAQLWHQIAARNGVVCPYGPRDRAEWNHCQPTSVKMILAANPLRETVTPTGPSDLESMFEAGDPMIVDMASAAQSLSKAAPTPVRALEANAKGGEPTARVAARPRTKREARATAQRVAAKPTRHAKLERVAAKSAKPTKAERLAAKSGRPAKAERIVITSSEPPKVERIVVKSSQSAKAKRIAAKSEQPAKAERVAAKSTERAKSERAAAKTARDAKLGQRKGGGRTVGAEESHQKSKSRRA
jgi:hypothetical protein